MNYNSKSKCQGIISVRIHPLGTMNIYINVYANPLKLLLYFSLDQSVCHSHLFRALQLA